MSELLKQSSAAYPLTFFMVDSASRPAGKTGLSPVVTLSKNGGAFASQAGTISEIANGWYKVAGNATDTGTLGPLLLHATGSGADAADKNFEVVGFDPQSLLLSSGTSTGQLNVSGGKLVDSVFKAQCLAVAVVQTINSQTDFIASSATGFSVAADTYKDCMAIILTPGAGASLPGHRDYRRILTSVFDGDTGYTRFTIESAPDGTWPNSVANIIEIYPPSIVSGYVSGQAPLQPTTAGRKLDVAATGEAGLDFDNIHDASGSHTLTNITIPIVTAATVVAQSVADALKLAPTAGSSAAGSAYAAIAATEQATDFADDFATAFATAFGLATDGATSVEDALDAQGYTTARAAKLDNLDISVSGATGSTPLSPEDPSRDETWRFDNASQTTAPNQISMTQGEVRTFRMDFSQPLNRATRSVIIHSLGTATISTSAHPPTLGTPAMSADGKCVDIEYTTVTGGSATTKGSYTVSIPISTTDSQTIVRKGVLVVK